MGMCANYMMVDDDEVDRMMELDEETLLDRIDELEDEGNEVHCLDRLWDGLHFLLTGKSAEDPIDDDELSAAIVGVHNFETDESFVACIEKEELEDVVKEMEKVDLEIFWKKRKLLDFRKKKIYPKIWKDEDLDSIKVEMVTEFNNLLRFYRTALGKKMNIIVSIY